MALTIKQAIATQVSLAYLGRPQDVGALTTFSFGMTAEATPSPTAAQLAALFATTESKSIFGVSATMSSVVSKSFELVGRVATAQNLTDILTWANDSKLDISQLPWEILKIAMATESQLPQASQVVWARLSVAYQLAEDISGSATALQSLATSTTQQGALRDVISGVTSFATIATAYPATGSGTAANFVSGSASSSGQTFTLTIGADTGAAFTGTAANNTFDATGFFNAPNAATLQTLGNADSINGGDGTDTLNVALNTATATTRPAALTSIEVINLTNTVGTNVLDLANATGVTTLNSVNSATQIAQFNNVQSAPTAFGLTNTAVGLTANILNTALAGTTDAATLTLNGVTGGTVTLQTITAASGYETLNIVSAGATANVLTAVTAGNGTSLARINVSGAAAINLGTTLDATVLTVDASALTGILTVVQTNAVRTVITGGSGNDVIDVSGAFVDLTDTTNADVINGGAGTNALILAYAEGAAVTTAAEFANVTNIQTIRFDTVAATTAINGTRFTGVTTFEFDGGIAALSHTLASGQEIQYDLLDADNDAQTFTIAGTGTTDSMTIDINGVDIGAGTQTYVGVETLNIATSGTALMDGAHVMTATAANETMNISGTDTLTLGNITADTINVTMTAGTLNLGIMQQVTNLNGSGSAAAITATGSTAADILIGGTGADFLQNVLSGTAAFASAGDIMTGGAGFDTFTLTGTSASTTNYSGSPTITDFTVGTSATNTDFLRFTTGNQDYQDDAIAAAGLGVVGTADGATGAVVVQTVAQNAAAAAGATGVNFVKLTTGVAFDTSLQVTFNAAIGTSTLTAMGTDVQVAGSYYDTTNSLMVIWVADTSGGASLTVLETADVVGLIGTVSMTAANYALIDADNFANFVA